MIRRGATGRAELLAVTGRGAPARLSASSFRFAVNRALGWNQIRSDWYTATVSGPALEMSGKGYGHGVGLCQAGAYEMARKAKARRRFSISTSPAQSIGITPADHGWQQVAGAGWTLLTTDPAGPLLAEGNAAWARAQSLLGKPAGRRANGPGTANHRIVPSNHGRAGLDAGLDPRQHTFFCSPPPCGKTTEEPDRASA